MAYLELCPVYASHEEKGEDEEREDEVSVCCARKLLEGLGTGEDDEGDQIHQAHTPQHHIHKYVGVVGLREGEGGCKAG